MMNDTADAIGVILEMLTEFTTALVMGINYRATLPIIITYFLCRAFPARIGLWGWTRFSALMAVFILSCIGVHYLLLALGFSPR